MARILITTFGSYGDLFPYLAIGSELRRRGHAVTIGTSAAYRGRVEDEGLLFTPIRPDVDLGDREFLKWVFDERRGSERIIRAMAGMIRDTYEDTKGPAYEADAIVTHPLTFAATLIAKKRRVPWASTVLAPISFLSAYDPSVLAPMPWLRKWTFLGTGFYRRFYDFGRWQTVRWVRATIEFAREELGLTREQVGVLVFEGSQSPQLTLALFSRVLAQPQPDWPASAIVTGFPFFSGAAQSEALAPELEQFLAAGPPPVVFTLGSSAVGAAGNFYRDSYRAVEQLGVRTLFLTGAHAQGLPEKLPAHMLEWTYAPHSALFPRAAAIVHQGGIGTTAEALRSGRPMLVVPFAHDQFDNAERCLRIGTARWTGRSAYNSSSAERELRAILGDTAMHSQCARVAAEIRSENGPATAADAIERITNC